MLVIRIVQVHFRCLDGRSSGRGRAGMRHTDQRCQVRGERGRASHLLTTTESHMHLPLLGLRQE